MGQQLHKYENLLNRNFQADSPNAKWVTDISYIHTGQGILYLSMIRDIYDNSIVAYKTATAQTVSLVLDTIRLAMKKERKKVATELQLQSDQGFQYTSQAYFDLYQFSEIAIKQRICSASWQCPLRVCQPPINLLSVSVHQMCGKRNRPSHHLPRHKKFRLPVPEQPQLVRTAQKGPW